MKRTTAEDERWMRQALALARRAEGLTRPNPPVGAMVVQNGRCIGRGWHKKAGTPHAEIIAMRAAGTAARNATLYVTLEPCSTHGRTPPCCDAIRTAGIRRVVVGAVDPNPQHSGRGLRLLRRAGVDVVLGACADEARRLIAPFATFIRDHRPHLTLKLGLSLDGRIADHTHASRWITGPDARDVVQAMRRSADAVMVGAGTIRHDNPSLWPRPDRGRQPWRVVVVRSGPLPLAAQIFNDAHAERTLVAAPRGWQPVCADAIRRKGATVWELPARGFWPALARNLAERDILHVLCEGGGKLAGELIQARWLHELCLFLSPLALGGTVGAMGDIEWSLKRPPRFRWLEARPVGQDVLLRAVPLWREN